MKKGLMILTMFMLHNVMAFSQVSPLEGYTVRVQQKINLFQTFLDFICKKEKYSSIEQSNDAMRNKETYIREALKLFMGENNPFIDEKGDTLIAPPPRARICTILKNGTYYEREIPLKHFLHKMKYHPCDSIYMESVIAFYPVHIQEVDENDCLITMERRRFPIREDLRVCSPQTIILRLKKQIVDGRIIWPVFLDDITLIANRK